MKAQQLDQALARKFIDEEHRLVFWHDTENEFTDYIASGLDGDLASVKILDVATLGSLSIKLLLEREDTRGQYLVYSHGERPAVDADWLLDIRLYSGSFHADAASIWLQDLGLSRLSLHDHLKSRTAFLQNATRREKLKRLLTAEDDEDAIDLKIVAVLTASAVASPFDVLMALCHGHLNSQGQYDLNSEPEALASIARKGLDKFFWSCMEVEFGYVADAPSVAGLLRRLLVTDFLASLEQADLPSLAQFRLPAARVRQVGVFLTQWRDSSSRSSAYDAIAEALWQDLSFDEKFVSAESPLPWEALCSVQTFLPIERHIAAGLRGWVLADVRPRPDELRQLVGRRCEGYWLAGASGEDDGERYALRSAYQAMEAATQLFDLLDDVKPWLALDDAARILVDYRDQWYQVDQRYRQFHMLALPALGEGWGLLKDLADEVERRYEQHFIQPLGLAWSQRLDEGFLQQWSTNELFPQPQFYQRVIAPYLTKPRSRAFVLISDALRFEAASELCERLNGKYRFNAELDAMLGVLPSYTGLGMASLLPYGRLDYNDQGDVLADGASTSGLAARSKVLSSVQGMACRAEELVGMKKEAARAFIGDHRVVYIYHNVIDAIGDSASTEDDAFAAVDRAIEDLAKLVRLCVNTLNAGRVWVTADHGFLFQQSPPSATDRSALTEKPSNAMKSKKRYVFGRDLGPQSEAHVGHTSQTAGTQDGVDFWIPRGANRFHFTGGARFVHGGAMPQEVVVPLISVSEIGGKKKQATRVKPVGVQLLGDKHKITTPRYRFEFIQTDAVGERRPALTARMAIYNGENLVSSVERRVFDSPSSVLDERKQSVKLELIGGQFDKRTAYYLKLYNTDTDDEVLAVPVVIDRSFDDDF